MNPMVHVNNNKTLLRVNLSVQLILSWQQADKPKQSRSGVSNMRPGCCIGAADVFFPAHKMILQSLKTSLIFFN